MAKARIGCVGCGFTAQTAHVPNILSTAERELTAAAEVRAELAENRPPFLTRLPTVVEYGIGGRA